MSEASAAGGASGSKKDNLSGPLKALLFIVSTDETVATRLLSRLSMEELRKLREVAEKMREANPERFMTVHQEFLKALTVGQPFKLKAGGERFRSLAKKALGDERVGELWTDDPGPRGGPVAELAKLDVDVLLGIFEREEPQMIAVILSQFEPDRASAVLQRFDRERQVDVVRRMVRLQRIPESVLVEIEKQFAAELEALGDIRRRDIDGVKAAVRILKKLDGPSGKAILDELGSDDDDEAVESLRSAMFTFEDLSRLDNRALQALLKEVANDQLILCLKTASDDMRNKIFSNLSSRAAAALKEELELLGPVRVSDVEAAQKSVIEKVLSLEQEGKIQIPREGGSDFV